MLAGMGNLPPAGPFNFTSWAIVGFIFQYLIRRRRFAWWAKYNCKGFFHIRCFYVLTLVDVLSAALDCGTGVATVLIYFWFVFPCGLCYTTDGIMSGSLQYPKNGSVGLDTVQSWWGNSVYTNTADWNMSALKEMPWGQTFG
jgi:hypothetical protein